MINIIYKKLITPLSIYNPKSLFNKKLFPEDKIPDTLTKLTFPSYLSIV